WFLQGPSLPREKWFEISNNYGDFRTTREWPMYQFFVPCGAGLHYSEVALKEYYGRLFYWVKEQIYGQGRPWPP
ncbi:MAG: hypothetical protein ACP5U1_17500, partial [Desulfomonilaceae bacterium]